LLARAALYVITIMSINSAPPATITIDVLKNLDSVADLKSLISADSNVLFTFAEDLALSAGKPISSAVGTSAASASLTLTATPSWKTASGVAFSLAPTAKCVVTVAAKVESLPVAMIVDSSTTTDVQIAAPANTTYINIDLDFGITGNVSGSGTVSGLVISGKASGSATTTLSFCQPVPSDTETLAALQLAFSAIVFPTAPDSAVRMAPGSSCRMSFVGSLNAELDLTYGLGNYKLSAPGAALVQQSLAKAWEKLTLPTATINAGAKATVTYTHTDNLGLVVVKPDATSAQLYLMRSSKDESDETAGINLGVTATKVALALDPTQISTTVKSVTGSATLATTVGNLMSSEVAKVNKLETAATTKLNSFISDVTGNAGLSVALSQQDGRIALFNFNVDLTHADLAAQSWSALLDGNMAAAMNIGGFTLLAGSGVSEQVKRACTLQFQFFNLYSWSDQSDFFRNSSAELGADGTIRILTDIGVEGTVATKKALDRVRLHFTATATENTKADATNAEIDLNIEISEKGDPKGALVLAQLIGMINGASLQSAIDAMTTYAKANPTGTLGMIAVLKKSAYSQLKCSPYAGGKPPEDQSQDTANWNAIHDATVSLMGLDFVKPWKYEDWGTFNSICNTTKAGALADRRNSGDPSAVPSTFWGNYQAQSDQVQYFFLSSAGGMNLFEDLIDLATATDAAQSESQWQVLLKELTAIVKGDFDIDYAKPISAAILAQATQQGAKTTVATSQAKDSSTYTATLTIV